MGLRDRRRVNPLTVVMKAVAVLLGIWRDPRQFGKQNVLATGSSRLKRDRTNRTGDVMRALLPPTLRAPFGQYAHGTYVPRQAEWVLTSGQLPVRPDDTVPDGAFEQARLCIANCAAILAEAGMGPADVVRIAAFVTDRSHMRPYMAARDAWLTGVDRLPASTLVIVSGFTRPEFLVEVEMTAARFDHDQSAGNAGQNP